MTDERDAQVPSEVSKRYRELGAEEPPRELDEEILAASRRGASARPASLDRATRQRWHAPLAAAAVLVLAVAVTLHVQVEQPQMDASVPPAPRAEKPAAPPTPPSVPAAKLKQRAAESRAEAKVFVPDPPPAVAQAPAAAPPPPPPAAKPAPQRDDSGAAAGPTREVGALARQAEERSASRDAAAERPRAAASAPMLAKRAMEAPADTPEKELERIATLRQEGRHEEADRALAEFRKRYPDFKIPGEMLQRVERR
jgi:hypothetical protein